MNEAKDLFEELQDKRFSSVEELLSEINEISKKDPTSPAFVRNDPDYKLNFLSVSLRALLLLGAAFLLGFIFTKLGAGLAESIIAGASLILLQIILNLKHVAIWFLKIYRALSKNSPRVCRFEPSCSVYSIQAFEKYGFIKGLIKTVQRLRRCHPPNGGHDPLE